MYRIICTLGLAVGLVSCGPAYANGWVLRCDKTPNYWSCNA